MLLEATSEVQRLALFHSDVLGFDIDNLQTITYVAAVGSVNSVSTLCFGVAGDHVDDEDAIAQNVWFKIEGATDTANIVVETDDGTLDNNDVATGTTLTSTFKEFVIDFTHGKSDVRFYVDDSNGQLRRVAATTTFDMSNYSGSLQPYMMVQKASGTGTPNLDIDYIEIKYKR